MRRKGEKRKEGEGRKGRKKGEGEREGRREETKKRKKGRTKGRKGRSYILALSRLLFKAFSLRSWIKMESAFPRSKSFKALSRLNVGLGLVSMIHIAPI